MTTADYVLIAVDAALILIFLASAPANERPRRP